MAESPKFLDSIRKSQPCLEVQLRGSPGFEDSFAGTEIRAGTFQKLIYIFETVESQIEMVPTNMHILQERYSFSAGQSISLVSQYFNLIPKAYFRKMVEVFEIIFTFGL